MKWQRWLLVAMIAVSITLGCGNGESGQDNQNQNDSNQASENDNDQNDNGGNDNDDDRDFSDRVDIWVGSETFNEDRPTQLSPGESFGGRFTSDSSRFFSVDLEAGEVVAVAALDFEAELKDSLAEVEVSITQPSDEQTYSARTFLPVDHDEREFFVPVDGSYELEVAAPGAQDAEIGFSFEIEERTVEPREGLEFPTSNSDAPVTTDGQDLDDAKIDAFAASVDQLQSIDLELFASRSPVSSSLDSWIYIFDVDNGELVAQGNDQDDDIVDPRLVFDLDGDADYWVVVDMVENHSDAAYEIVTDFIATSPTNPQVLSVGATDEFSGNIEERNLAPYFDYFEVTVDAGEYKRIVVEGDEDLEPVIEVDTEAAGTSSAPASFALPVDDVAGATLGVGEDEDTTTFSVAVSDQRNLMGQLDTYLGGDGFGYTISVEDYDASTLSFTPGTSQTVTLSSPGDIEVVEVNVADDHLLWLDSGHGLEPGQPLSPTDIAYLPAWAQAVQTTVASTRQLDAYMWGQGDVERFWLRDDYFRGGQGEHQSQVSLNTYDMENQSYLNTDLDAGGDTAGDAFDAPVPVRIMGSFDDPEPMSVGSHHFQFSANVGSQIVVATENDESMEAVLSLLDAGGDLVAQGARLMHQHRGDSYVDTALVFDVENSGTHTLNIEQNCQAFADCDTGDVEVRLFVQ